MKFLRNILMIFIGIISDLFFLAIYYLLVYFFSPDKNLMRTSRLIAAMLTPHIQWSSIFSIILTYFTLAVIKFHTYIDLTESRNKLLNWMIPIIAAFVSVALTSLLWEFMLNTYGRG